MHLLDIQYWQKQHKSSDLEPLVTKEKKIQEARRVFSAFSGLSNIPQHSKDWKTGPNKMFPLVESIIKGITDADDTRQDKGRKVQWKGSDTHKMVVAQRNNAITQASLVPTHDGGLRAPPAEIPESLQIVMEIKNKGRQKILGTSIKWDMVDAESDEATLHCPEERPTELKKRYLVQTLSPGALFTDYIWPGNFKADAEYLHDRCKHLPHWPQTFGQEELRRWFAIFFGAACRAERGSALFRNRSPEPKSGFDVKAGDVGGEAHFAKLFGMPERHYNIVKNNIWKIWKTDGDPWYISELHKRTREHHQSLVSSGWLALVDEKIFEWRPRTTADGYVPHVSWVHRKPIPIGIEFKNIVTLEGFELANEIVDSKEVMQKSEHRAQCTYAGGACVARLASLASLPKGTVVVGDAGFGSVAAAAYLHTLGIYCIMNIKDSSSFPAVGFPKAQLASLLEGHAAGTSVAMRAGVEWRGSHTVPMLAVAYRYSRSKPPQFFVATAGSMRPGDPSIQRFRDEVDQPCEKLIAQPQLLNWYWKIFSRIDRRNQIRQGVLRLEKVWRTRDAKVRLTTSQFAEMLVELKLHVDFATGSKHKVLGFAARSR